MEKLVIEGGHPLSGEVFISGSKNAALPVLVATVLADGVSILHNVPDLADINTMIKLISYFGVQINVDKGRCTLDTHYLNSVEARYDIVRTMRASVLVLGPLLARFGQARVSLPGGCAIGARPVHMHLDGLKAMGAILNIQNGYIDAKTPKEGLRGARIVLESPSVGATEHLMMAAALARGETVIENVALEPEIERLALALRSGGAQIEGVGSSILRIQGVKALKPINHHILPDRIETGTFIAAGAIMGANITLRNVVPSDISAIVDKFKEAGCQFEWLRRNDDSGLADLSVFGPKELTSTDIDTAAYPGFPTDMQAQFMTAMSLARGRSLIRENIFENRFMHVPELNRMGANIEVDGNEAVVHGVTALSGAPVMATDLRASASLVLGGLRASGTTEVLRVYHLDRGYMSLEKKLSGLGAQIKRVKQE